MRLRLILSFAALAALGASSFAASVTVVKQNGTIHQTTALTGFQTFGDMMDGMAVTVQFSDGSVQNTVWADGVAPGSGFAEVLGWFSITEAGDTFQDNAWTLSNTNPDHSITRIFFDGAPGDTIFDTTFGGNFGTSGSARGKDFNIVGNYSVTATYRDAIALTGDAPVGDIFKTLEVEFSSSTPFLPTASTTFSQDTDNTEFAGDIRPVPELGSTGLLLGLGLLTLVRRNRRAA